MIALQWKEGLVFEGESPSGHPLVFDTVPEDGASSAGPTPMEMLLASAAACSAMDVVSILRKKQQAIQSYRVEVVGERTKPGVWPRPYAKIEIRHIVEGDGIDPQAVERALELTDEKYCSVFATLRENPTVVSTFRIETTAKRI